MSIPQPPMSIVATGLVKRFGETTALNDVSLSLPEGQSTIIFGPNGAGKSTFLRVMATLTTPDEGTVQIGGFDTRKHPALVRQCIGFLGHHTLLHADLTVRENLRFYGRLYRVHELEHRINEVLSEVNVLDSQDQKIRSLSNGIQKRVGLARALIHHPQILLLDEPDAGLDQQAKDSLSKTLKLSLERGVSVLLTSHDIAWGLQLAHKASVLSQGRMIFEQDTKLADIATINQFIQTGKVHHSG